MWWAGGQARNLVGREVGQGRQPVARLARPIVGRDQLVVGREQLDRPGAAPDPDRLTDQLLRHLRAGRADGSTDQRLQCYLAPALLVIDDFGLKPLPPTGPVDLYDVINGRYEKGSIVVTSNRTPAEWPELFGDPLLANAGLDRLGHRAAVLLISGRSFRMVDRPDLQEVPMPTT